jgi:hypothetical protein
VKKDDSELDDQQDAIASRLASEFCFVFLVGGAGVQ